MALFCFSACSGGGNSTPPPPGPYSIGGTVTNLAGTNAGLVLQDNGGDNLPVDANGAFTFATPILRGSTYKVTVLTQPSSPVQICGVTQGTGTVTGNVISIVVNCVHNEWTWESGSSSVNQLGIYGTQGMAAPGNVPGARYGAVSWADAAGNLWLFGGVGYNVADTGADLNDLWKYSAGEWTWMSGANTALQQGTYGMQGTPAPGNVPGARDGAVSWIDASGNFWLFGGYVFDSAQDVGYFNDLWKYSSGEWTWMSGANVEDQYGSYGSLGTPARTNVPGARTGSVSWPDASGNFWLFGGYGCDSTGVVGWLNDLWKYSAGEWTWMSGSNVNGQYSNYGTLGTAAPSNVPGARQGVVSWTDTAGNFWIFGGLGPVPNPTVGFLNDLWKYSASSGEWTWMGGANVYDQPGIYGTQGTADPGNVPGARTGSVSWTDAAGNFWLFGGLGEDSIGVAGGGFLNDLWEYSVSSGQWTWMSGANTAGQPGIYGTQGTTAPGNVPGERYSPVAWTDPAGIFWLFGGEFVSNGTHDYFNDLWKYEP